MILAQQELESLIRVQHRSPHQFLGMHPLGNGGGLVVRAFWPRAAQVEIVPTHEKNKPAVKLKRVHDHGVFEGTVDKTKQVYAYDLVITEHDGHKIQTRDPYSFLPSLGEQDLFLFAQGNERKIYDKLGSHIRTFD